MLDPQACRLKKIRDIVFVESTMPPLQPDDGITPMGFGKHDAKAPALCQQVVQLLQSDQGIGTVFQDMGRQNLIPLGKICPENALNFDSLYAVPRHRTRSCIQHPRRRVEQMQTGGRPVHGHMRRCK